MNKKWNLLSSKVLMFFVAAIMAATSTIAIPKSPCDDKGDVCCDSQIKPGPFAFSYAKDLGLSCPSDFYFRGEFLWTKPQEDGLDYAINNLDATPGGFQLIGGSMEGFSTDHHEWDWNPGFRVGFGMYLTQDAWNIDVNWTYIRIKDESSFDHKGDGGPVALWLPAGSYTPGASNKQASARWKGDFNTVDFKLAKPYHVSRYYIMNPNFGFRAAFIDQDYTARYAGYIDSAATNGAEMKAHNNFWGVGMRAGMDTEWLMGNNFNLYANFGFSILYGKFDISQRVDLNSSNAYDLDWDFYTNVPNMEMMFGIVWSTFFNKNRALLSFKAGYEFHYWWSQNRMKRFVDSFSSPSPGSVAGVVTVAPGALSFNGFTFGFQIDF